MDVAFSAPFRLYEVFERPGRKGRRRVFKLESKARRAAEAGANAAGCRPEELLRESKYFYSRAYGKWGAETRRISTKKETLQQAKDWVDAQRRTGLPPSRGRGGLSIADAAQRWLEELRLAGRRTSTLRQYAEVSGVRLPDGEEGFLGRATPAPRSWVGFFGPSRALASIDRESVLEFLRARGRIPTTTKAPKGKKPATKPASARTMNLAGVILKSFFSWAVRRGLCASSPAADLPRQKEPKKEPKTLADAQVAALVRAASEPYKQTLSGCRNAVGVAGGASTEAETTWEQEYEPPAELRPLVILAVTSLLRVGTLRLLEWRDIDLRNSLLLLRPETMKTNVHATIPLSPAARAALVELPRGGAADRVFPGDFRKAFSNACRRAGLPAASFHVLRRTGASFLLRRGVGIDIVRRLGTWSTEGDILLKHYRSVGIDELRGAVKLLDELVGEAKAPALAAGGIS